MALESPGNFSEFYNDTVKKEQNSSRECKDFKSSQKREWQEQVINSLIKHTPQQKQQLEIDEFMKHTASDKQTCRTSVLDFLSEEKREKLQPQKKDLREPLPTHITEENTEENISYQK